MIRVLKKVLTYIPRFVDRITVWSGYCGAFLLFFAMLAVNFDVIARYLFNRPTMWAFDISRWTLLFATLLLAAWVLHEDGHVKIDIVPTRLKEKPRVVIETITSFLTIVGCVVLFYQGAMSAAEDFISGIKTSDIIEIRKFWLSVPIAVGGFLLTCQGIRRFNLNFSKFVTLTKRQT